MRPLGVQLVTLPANHMKLKFNLAPIFGLASENIRPGPKKKVANIPSAVAIHVSKRLIYILDE